MRQKAKIELAEEKVHDALDGLCDSTTQPGRWLTSLDFFMTTGGGQLGSVPYDQVLGSSEICRRGFNTTLTGGGEFLLVERKPTTGHCGRECATAAQSCDQLLSEEVEGKSGGVFVISLVDRRTAKAYVKFARSVQIDRDDLAVALWRGDTGAGALVRTVCLDWTRRCRGKRKIFPGVSYQVEFLFCTHFYEPL